MLVIRQHLISKLLQIGEVQNRIIVLDLREALADLTHQDFQAEHLLLDMDIILKALQTADRA